MDDERDKWTPDRILWETIKRAESASALGVAFTDIQARFVNGDIGLADYLSMYRALSSRAGDRADEVGGSIHKTFGNEVAISPARIEELAAIRAVGNQARDAGARMLEALVAGGKLTGGKVKLG